MAFICLAFCYSLRVFYAYFTFLTDVTPSRFQFNFFSARTLFHIFVYFDVLAGDTNARLTDWAINCSAQLKILDFFA